MTDRPDESPEAARDRLVAQIEAAIAPLFETLAGQLSVLAWKAYLQGQADAAEKHN